MRLLSVKSLRLRLPEITVAGPKAQPTKHGLQEGLCMSSAPPPECQRQHADVCLHCNDTGARRVDTPIGRWKMCAARHAEQRAWSTVGACCRQGTSERKRERNEKHYRCLHGRAPC